MQVDVRGDLLCELQPAAVVLEPVVRVDAALHADLGDAELDGIADLLRELVLGHVVGVRRAASLTEAAEGAADLAHVGEVDVPVDDEGHDLTGNARADLVRREADVLDHLRAALREQRGQLLARQPLVVARPLDRP